MTAPFRVACAVVCPQGPIIGCRRSRLLIDDSSNFERHPPPLSGLVIDPVRLDGKEARLSSTPATAPTSANPAPAMPALLSVSEAARRLGISRSYAYSLHERGLLKIGRVAGTPRVARTEIERVAAVIAAGGEV